MFYKNLPLLPLATWQLMSHDQLSIWACRPWQAAHVTREFPVSAAETKESSNNSNMKLQAINANGMVLQPSNSCWYVVVVLISDRKQTVLVEFFTICVSVRLSDRSLHREEQKKSLQKLPQWGLKPEPPDHKANALPTELSQHSVASLNLHDLYKVTLYWF